MTKIQTKNSLLILIVGFFFYSLLINVPQLIQNIAVICGYITNFTGDQLIILKIATWILVTIIVLILIAIKSKGIYAEKNGYQMFKILSKKAMLILGLIAIMSKVLLFYIKNIENYYLIEFLENNNDSLSEDFINKIYFFDGYLHSGLILVLLITFLIILLKSK